MGTNGYPPAADSALTEQRSCRSAVAGVRTPVHLFGQLAARMRLVSVLTENRIERGLADRAKPFPLSIPLVAALFSTKRGLTCGCVTVTEPLCDVRLS